jgi:glyoxylase-like metal-dependent hydrolase (beta-lactamase superfamily II)
MKISATQVGYLQTNCYLIEDETEKVGWLVDPGEQPEKIQAMVDERGVRIQAILLTHAHFDHFGAAGWAAETYDCPILLSAPEAEEACAGGVFVKGHIRQIFQEFRPVWEKRGQCVTEGQTLTLGRQHWQVMLIPGHSPACTCYYHEPEGVLIAGDTLFRESIGRTDYYQGDPDDLRRNLKERIASLPDDVVVLPGHGPSTTIGWEKTHNPYL